MSVLEPSKMPVPFASGGLKNTIPANSNPVTGKAGYSQGFPAINMTAKEAGGIPPFGQDFNGILFEITNAIRYAQQGGLYTYDLSFATAIGGYKKGSVLAGKISTALYQTQVDGNLTDPEGADAAGWSRFGPSSYGVPMIGELVMWPAISMPQDIWPDIGAKFIPYMAQAFSKELYPLLAQLHPSGFLPSDMRGEFVRGWDNGRGVDTGRVLSSTQTSTLVSAGDTTRDKPAVVNLYNDYDFDSRDFIKALGGEWPAHAVPGLSLASVNLTTVQGVAGFVMGVRPRNIAWHMIVRAS